MELVVDKQAVIPKNNFSHIVGMKEVAVANTWKGPSFTASGNFNSSNLGRKHSGDFSKNRGGLLHAPVIPF